MIFSFYDFFHNFIDHLLTKKNSGNPLTMLVDVNELAKQNQVASQLKLNICDCSCLMNETVKKTLKQQF
jgi:hypothetical protein